MLHASLVALSITLIVIMELFLNRSVQTSISQYLRYAYSIGPEDCEMEVLNGKRFLRLLNAKSGFIYFEKTFEMLQ